MNKEEFLNLVKQYSNETMFLSFIKLKHPAYLKLLEAGPDAIPWALERLKDTIGRESGNTMDKDNDPWMLFNLIYILSNGESRENFPAGAAGNLCMVREHYLKWGESKGYIKL